MSFDKIWENIVNCAGQKFITKTGLPFVYQVLEDSVVPARTGIPIPKSDFEKAADSDRLSGPADISSLVTGPAYVYAILSDFRIRP